ncbi:efflux RND transporter periplasmic adaptor subunit [Rossellomorea aquimaris]|nr:efflux RND transporter periplasmic adaptor subunit [Rossellomorea aquimaris]WRP06595.1 efflux RND transporter periplasmic adaptor subunit [Rossellomorea aquimaris]
MFKNKWWITASIFLVFAILIVFNVVNRDSVSVTGTKDGVLVKTEKIKKKSISNTTLISGVVKPETFQGVYNNPEKGNLQELFVEAGDEVEVGEKLFSYNNDEIIYQLNQAEITRSKILIQLEQQNKQMKVLKKKISEVDNNEVKKELNSQLEDLEFQNRISNLDYKQSENEVKQLQQKKDSAYERSKIKGIVQNVNVDDRTPTNNNPIIEIESGNKYIIAGLLTEFEKYQLSEGQSVKVISKVEKDKSWSGKIEVIKNTPVSNNLDANSETGSNVSYYPYIVKLDNDDGLENGFHVSLEVETNVSNDVLAIPNSSIVQNSEEEFVFVLVNENQLEKRKIETGLAADGFIEIKKGLKENEEIIVEPTEDMKSGMEVKVND